MTIGVILPLSLALGNPLQAQQSLGTLNGSVADTTGAKVVGAEVMATDTTTNFVTKVVTNSAGEYSIPFLQPDTYVVTVTANGFRIERRTGLALTAGASLQADFSLKPGSVAESVVVTANTQLLDATSANVETIFSTEQVTDTPNIGRNPFVLADFAAGIFNSGSGGYFQGKSSTFTTPFAGVAVQIDSNGSSGHNRLTLDGSPDDPSERFSGASYTGFVPSPEAVQEVKVQTAVYDAQFGHGDGVVTNTVLRTGSNQYHGAAYDVFRNTYMNANTYERVPTQNSAPAGTALTPRGTDQWEQPGFVFDGPLNIPKLYHARDKTFFMVAYEYIQYRTPLPYSTLVPTKSGGLSGLGNVGGDFSNLCSTFNATGVCTSGIQIYDPLSVTSGNGNRSPFPYNLIPSNRISPAGAAMLALMPAPNSSLSPTINYIAQHTTYPNKYFSFVSRFDHQFSERQHIDGTFFKANLHQLEPLEGFPGPIGPTGIGYTVFRNNAGGNIEDSYVISPTLVVDARFGLIYHPFGLVYPGNNFNLSTVGINGSNLPVQSFPGSTFTDSYLAQGTTADGLAAGSTGQISEDTLGSTSVLVAKAIQKHSIRAGFEGNLSRYNVQNPQSGLGAFSFNREFTQQNDSGATGTSCPATNCVTGSDPTSGNPIASLLLGYPSSGSYANTIAFALQQKYIAFFVQDDWRITNKLTVNAGLRWDYESPFSERYNRLNAGFCTTCVNPLQSSVAGLTLNGGLTFVATPASPSRYSAPQEYSHFQPRFGVAYQVTPKVVARAGFGLVYFNTQDSPANQAGGYSQTTSYSVSATQLSPINTLANPFPSGVLLPTGNTLGLSTLLGQNVTFPDPNSVQPKMWQYSASLQFELPAKIAVQLAYVGNKVSQLPINKQIDDLPASYFGTITSPANATALNAKVANPLAGQLASSTTLNPATIAQYYLNVPYPEFTGVTDQYISAGSALYNSLQFTVHKALTHNFEINGNFTFSKIMDQNVYLNPQATTPFRYQDAQPNILSNIYGTYHLPELKGKSIYLREVLGGWKLQGVLRADNAPLIGSIPNNTGSQYGTSQTYTMLRSPKLANPNRSLLRYFNTCYETAAGALVYTTTSASGAVVPGCDATNNNIPAFQLNPPFTLASVGPELNVREQVHPLVDASLFKQFQIRESVSFEIRGEFFNAFNTPNFGGPGLTPGSATFGVVTLTQLNDPRLTQLTARINF